MPKTSAGLTVHLQKRFLEVRGEVIPGETKKILGKLYVVPADERELIAQYRKDFRKSAE